MICPELIRKINALVAIFILLLCNTASANNTETIEIYGELQNFKERVVQVIVRWKMDGKYYKDSSTVKHSKYLFKTTLSEPTFFSLQPKYQSKTGEMFFKVVNGSRESFGFFLEPKKIKLTSIDSFNNTICTGSEANKVLLNFKKSIFKSVSELEAEANIIFQSLNISNADSVDIKQKIYDSLSINEDVKHFKQNAKTMLGPNLLNSLYDQRYSVSKLKELYELLSDECKRTNSARLLLEKLNNYSPLAVGQSFDWFTMPDTSGKSINVVDLGHKIILIDLWASWCAPCRQQMTALKQVYGDFHHKGFEVVAVSLDEKPNSWKKAIVDDELPWINVSDLRGWNNDLIVKYYIQSIPYNILIDNKGKIVATNISMDDLIIKCKNLMPNL